jgi:hypothetical protein
MRGGTWSGVKPILKVLQEQTTARVNTALIIKPDNFWQKQRTSLASHKYKFEVSVNGALYFFFERNGVVFDYVKFNSVKHG